MYCCLRVCRSGNMRKSVNGTNRIREPEIQLDAAHMGSDVILLSNQLRITGTGGALATAPLVQSKSYFEIKIQQAGYWSVGLATPQADLTKKFGGCDKESWCFCSDNATRHNNEEFRPVIVTTKQPQSGVNTLLKASTTEEANGLVGIEDVPENILLTTGGGGDCNDTDLIQTPQSDFPDEGDIIGVAFDHVELNFYFNGKNLEVPFRNVKGDVYPVVYVGDGAVLDIILDNFHHGPPPGFDRIMLEQSLL